MHTHDLAAWSHHHSFNAENLAAERSTRIVTAITAFAMVIEIGAGWWYNSMALLADGWHMSSHAVALGLSAYAYSAARRHAGDTRFAFGTWKIEVLGAFASAVLLLGVALVMVIDSVERLFTPEPIRYIEAMAVATLGLLVNIICAVILGRARVKGSKPQSHDHDHGNSHGHGHSHQHAHGEDLNLKSAFVHVAADAATSVLAIVALFGGLRYGWAWLDPTMGIVGAGVIVVWALGLLAETGKVLLDREMDDPVVNEIREVIESGPEAGSTRITDLHVWRVGRNHYACALSLVTHDPALTPKHVREQLAIHKELAHLTIEIHQCE